MAGAGPIRIHTYSIVMRDPDSGALGVGVQSHFFNVGRIVPWVRPGAGAVATQATADPHYGPRGLDLMAAGTPAPLALETLLSRDPAGSRRQVAFVDARGEAAAHTGADCIPYASHVLGDGWAVQANIMRDDRVVPAMAETAGSAAGDLADRILAVLGAAEWSGGDLRGSQSAALVITGDGPVPALDLRVEDHPDPIGELRRLLPLHRAYEHLDRGAEALLAGDRPGAAAAYRKAAELGGGNPEILFWQAIDLAAEGDLDAARPFYRRAVQLNPDLRELLGRLPATGEISNSAAADLDA